MGNVLLCLDSGTTSIKAAAFDDKGSILAAAERPNGALHRQGLRVEQDMLQTRAEAMAVLRDCIAQLPDPVIAGLILTGQGDGLWPLDRAGEPVGMAMTWLDGRARQIMPGLDQALDSLQALTGVRPTAASASLQLLWLQRHDPQRLGRITHALRLKEWLFLSLTGRIMGEPAAALPVWGDWKSGAMLAEVPQRLDLSCGLSLLPEFTEVGACRAALTPQAARDLGLSAGIPVLMGPGDVQATLIGLRLGTGAGITRASIFGTSAIHACLHDDPAKMPESPAGAMVQKFVLGSGYLCFHPAFNGTTVLHQIARQFVGMPGSVQPHYSPLILHPFFEPGGERAPWTDPNATGALFGLTAATEPAEIAWAGREALAFVACKSHAMMGASDGTLSLGGGLSGDPHFAQFLATLMGDKVETAPAGHAGLRGLAAVGARFLLGADDRQIATHWLGAPGEVLAPGPENIAAYAQRKYKLFLTLIEAAAANWPAISDLRGMADDLMKEALQ